MNNIIYIIVIITLLSSVGCSYTSSLEYIDIESRIHNKKICSLSEFADSVSYIMLETTDECLLPGNSSITYIDGQNIFVNGGNYIYRFSFDGKFQNRIGSVGGGPQEYPQLLQSTVNKSNKYIMALSYNGLVCVYDYAGNFIKRLNLDIGTKRILYSNSDSFACVVNEYKTQYLSYLVIYNYNSEVLNKFFIESDSDNFKRILETVPIVYNSDGIIKIKSIYNDTLWHFTNEKIQVGQIFGLGRYSPGREVVENIERKKELLTKYMQIVDIQESEKYFFLIAIFQEKIRGIVIDRGTKNILFNNDIEHPHQNGGIQNDLKNKGYFWPMISYKGNFMAQLVDLSYIREQNMYDDPNPAVQVVHMKNK